MAATATIDGSAETWALLPRARDRRPRRLRPEPGGRSSSTCARVQRPEHTASAPTGRAVEAIARAPAAHARARDVPVFFTTTAYQPDGRDGGIVRQEDPGPARPPLDDPAAIEIDPRIAPADGEIVIKKKFASAVLRDEPAVAARHPRRRHGDPHGLLDVRLHPRDGGRRRLSRLPHDRAARSASPTAPRSRTGRTCSTSTPSTATSSASMRSWSTCAHDRGAGRRADGPLEDVRRRPRARRRRPDDPARRDPRAAR